MLLINRLRVEIETPEGTYGIDEKFAPGLNFIASINNTCGKSSVLAAVYYCLGLEQIIGGVGGIGPKVLTAAYKSDLQDGNQYRHVLESGAYLEISNGFETVTIFRNIKAEGKDPHLVTVFYSDYASIGSPNIQSIDYYVHAQNSATNERGFHTFLESFLHLELPIVSSSDGSERKLYLQIIFSALFIEQKHGWASILSGMPILGIRESKKRVVEFLLNLDTLKNERERNQLKEVKAQLENKWDQAINKIQTQCSYESCSMLNIPAKPRILRDTDISRIAVLTLDDIPLLDAIEKLKAEYDDISTLNPRVIENFDELNAELNETQAEINTLTQQRADLAYSLSKYERTIKQLSDNLTIIVSDIQNNNDAARLQRFGSDEQASICTEFCPICNQRIQDNMLHLDASGLFMSIEDNITHLKEQKKLLEFSLHTYQEKKTFIERELVVVDTKLLTLRRLAHALRSDLYKTTDVDTSEAIMLKKIRITRAIEQYTKLQDTFDSFIDQIKELSKQWSKYLERKQLLPASGKTEADTEKIIMLKKAFINNLKLYNYSSITDYGKIDISEESLLPTIDGFDMKYDSSASDGIRLIWAYTMALLQVSSEKDGNHPGLLIMDEPAQQSIIPSDMESFINSLASRPVNNQILMAITLNSQELINIIDALGPDTYHKISIIGRAFYPLSQEGVSAENHVDHKA